MTSDDDDRITRVGRVLRSSPRRAAADLQHPEWEMSWIGPRPEAEVLSVWYTSEIPFYRYRHVVKPGISGWAQVNQGHVAEVEDVHRKLQYDFYYIKYFSPWLDLLILFRTIKTMLTGFGSRCRRGLAHHQEHRQDAERDHRDHDARARLPSRSARPAIARHKASARRRSRSPSVAPSARPVTRPSPGNCSAVATAPTALTPPASSGEDHRPEQRLAVRAARHQREHGDRQRRAGERRGAISTGLRPTRSDAGRPTA